MSAWYNDLSKIFAAYPDVSFGFSATDFSRCKDTYSCALVYAVAHTEQLSEDTYEEKKFEEILNQTLERSNVIANELIEVLKKHNIVYCIPPAAQSNEQTLIAPFSFKFAAVCAGLGWIGKNNVLITEGFGPRVRLSAILIDTEPPLAPTIAENKCPSDCTYCVDACPYNALYDRRWRIDIKRGEMIDYQLCNQKRSLYLKTHQRKNACGLCMVSCPVGSQNIF